MCGLAFLSCIVENCRWRKLKIFNFLLKNFPVWHGGKRSGISEEVKTSHDQIWMKEGTAMPSPSYDDRLIAMFDSYCKEVSRNYIEYYPPWEPPVSRLRATWKFPPWEPPQTQDIVVLPLLLQNTTEAIACIAYSDDQDSISSTSFFSFFESYSFLRFVSFVGIS